MSKTDHELDLEKLREYGFRYNLFGLVSGILIASVSFGLVEAGWNAWARFGMTVLIAFVLAIVSRAVSDSHLKRILDNSKIDA
jgi:hypothetical protein